jgi:hypothetical protein
MSYDGIILDDGKNESSLPVGGNFLKADAKKSSWLEDGLAEGEAKGKGQGQEKDVNSDIENVDDFDDWDEL